MVALPLTRKKNRSVQKKKRMEIRHHRDKCFYSPWFTRFNNSIFFLYISWREFIQTIRNCYCENDVGLFWLVRCGLRGKKMNPSYEHILPNSCQGRAVGKLMLAVLNLGFFLFNLPAVELLEFWLLWPNNSSISDFLFFPLVTSTVSFFFLRKKPLLSGRGILYTFLFPNNAFEPAILQRKTLLIHSVSLQVLGSLFEGLINKKAIEHLDRKKTSCATSSIGYGEPNPLLMF